MGRFEWIGTSPEYVNAAAGPALDVHRALGAGRKAARLRWLTAHWRARAAKALPDARFHTTDADEMSCGLCTIDLPATDPGAMQRRLFEHHHILVQAMTEDRAPEIRGLRISPNVYTTPAELDRFVEALNAVAHDRGSKKG